MERSPDTIERLNDITEITKINDANHRFINKEFKKVSYKMYDYNCDVKLLVDTKTFQAHREVLSEASDYFAAMFGHDMQEKSKDAIEIHEISPVGFSSMMEYFYRGHVTLDDDIVADVIEAARFFQVPWLVNACCLFLIRHTSIENFDSVLELAEQFALGDLRYDIYRFIGDNFVPLAENKRFHSMSLELFSDILGNDFYIEAPEELILQIVVEWLEHDFEERKSHAGTLMNCIRFPLLHSEVLKNLPNEIKELPEVARLVQRATDYLDNPLKQCLITSDDVKLRGSRDVVAIMSVSEELLHGLAPLYEWIQYKDPALKQGKFINETFETSHLECSLEHCAITQFGNFLFIAGGYNQMYHSTNAVYCYDQRFKTWIEAPPMLEPRCNFVLCASKTKLYAAGGVNHDEEDQEVVSKTVEVFNPVTNEWTYTTPMHQPTFDHGGTYADGNLMISGGIVDNPNFSIPDNSSYELLESGVWVVNKHMIMARQGHSMVTHGDKVFVFGGYTSIGEMGGYNFIDCSVNEIYDLKTEQWSVITPTPEIYGHLQRDVAAIGNIIYLIGGQTNARCLVMFDAKTKEFVDKEPVESNFNRLSTLSIAYPSNLLQNEEDGDDDGDELAQHNV